MTTCRSAVARMDRWTLSACAVLIACAGCGRPRHPVVPVSGTVVLDGRPLAGGVINFQPIVTGTAVNAGPGSTARIDAEGRFSLATIRGEPGAVVGNHRVKIYSFSPESPVIQDGAPRAERERVPERYNYRSDVVFEVPPSGTAEADFSISSR